MTTATPMIANLTCDEARRAAAEEGLTFDLPDKDWYENGATLEQALKGNANMPFARHFANCPSCSQIGEAQFGQMVRAIVWVLRYTEDEYQLNGKIKYYSQKASETELKIDERPREVPLRHAHAQYEESLKHFTNQAEELRQRKLDAERNWVALFV